MTNDDALFRFRLRVMALAKEPGNVRAACPVFGIHHSTYYPVASQMVRHGTTEVLRPHERRTPRMPDATPVLVEGRVLAYALAHPGQGPRSISAELARDKWGGICISPNGAWGCCAATGLNTRAARLGLVAGYTAPPEPTRLEPNPSAISRRNVWSGGADGCFCIGHLAGTKGTLWQYTAIAVASA